MLFTNHKRPTYQIPHYVTGTAGFTDADPPNTTPPPADRVFGLELMPVNRLATIFTGGGGANPLGTGGSATFILCNGTSASIRWWWKDETTGLWFSLANTLNLNYASNNLTSFQGVALPGAKFFPQITANNGVSRFAQCVR